MFEGFTQATVQTEGAEIALVRGGCGPALLLLDGYPQTRAVWNRVVPTPLHR